MLQDRSHIGSRPAEPVTATYGTEDAPTLVAPALRADFHPELRRSTCRPAMPARPRDVSYQATATATRPCRQNLQWHAGETAPIRVCQRRPVDAVDESERKRI